MNRRPSTQDLTWLIDLHNNRQLDLDPPYQRRSVWTRPDKQFFLDTLFRNYPSPAIFLHKTIDDAGKATYHVVDGKQRTQTIIDFINDRLRIAKNYGDVRLDGKKWSELQGEQELKQSFWNYQITVEMIDIVEGTVVNEVFDRLNRNARKLTRQELRHAKFEGWLIDAVEKESTREEWRALGVSTTARARRMVDVQFISELMQVVIEGRIVGFDQDVLDELYATYEEPGESVPEFNSDDCLETFSSTRNRIVQLNANGAVTQYGSGFGNFYSLWCLLVLCEGLPDAATLEARYAALMQQVEKLAEQKDLESFLREGRSGEYGLALTYFTHSRGASTDLGPRTERLTALRTAVIGANS